MPDLSNLTAWQARAVQVINHIHGEESANELANKYRIHCRPMWWACGMPGSRERIDWWPCQDKPPAELFIEGWQVFWGTMDELNALTTEPEEYELSELVPIPAKCPRCKRNFLGKEAIVAPSLANVCCFYCGPNRSVHLVPHPDHPVIDAATRRHGLFKDVKT